MNEITKNIDVEKILQLTMKAPTVKIDRERFLRKELNKYYSEDVVNQAIEYNPAYAGITSDQIHNIAKQCIGYETKKVSAASFALGLPGGPAIIGTIPADMSQYYASILRILQKLAYLYGFEEFEIREDEINDNTMSEMLVFMGVMFGVQGANTALSKIAESAANHIAKKMARKALTKTAYYPLIKSIAQQLGYKVTKESFAKNISKGVAVVGGVIGGGLSYLTFRPCANRLRKELERLPLCNPSTYKD